MLLGLDRLPRWVAPWALLALVVAGPACVDLTPPPRAIDANLPDTVADRPSDRPDRAPDLAIDVPDAPDDSDPADAGDVADGDEDLGDGGGDDGLALALGQGCASNSECHSGLCVDSVCCADSCVGSCVACNIAGEEGSCTPVAGGEDPANECAMSEPATCGNDGTCNGLGACRLYQDGTQCQPGSCSGMTETPASTCAAGVCAAATPRQCAGGAVCKDSSCGTSCAADSGCQTGFFCETGVCRAKRAAGLACTGTSQCASGYCVDQVCCGTQCTELCSVCNLAGSAGTCKPVPAGQDPRNVCIADTGNSCGSDGTCNGAGACRRPLGTACGTSSCTGTVLTPAGMCNGAGTCSPQAPRECGAYACAGAACATSCTTDAACTPGHICATGACVALPGPVLHWKLDEASGPTAIDASGNGHNGTYVGGSGPVTSALVPSVMFPNPASRSFTRAAHHAIQRANMPPSLKPTADLTMSVWYRAVSVGASEGAELISAGDSYGLRLWSDLPKISGTQSGMEMSKNIAAGHVQCFLPNSTVLDGNWHHVAGVITTATMVLYVDGVATAPCPMPGPIDYLSSNDFWVGRHGNGTSSNWDFDGNIDEVRIYPRALSAAEIARLAAGKP